MGIPVATREYTPRACRNSRKSMRLPPHHEMRPDSPALYAEELCFPNQTYMEPRFAWLNSRESPTRLSQDEKNTDVTSGTQNSLVYPKSTQDEAHFHFLLQEVFLKQGWTPHLLCLLHCSTKHTKTTAGGSGTWNFKLSPSPSVSAKLNVHLLLICRILR